MKTASLLISYLSPVALLGYSGLTTAVVIPRSDADTIANFGRIGICLSYFDQGPVDKELAPCKIFCPAQNPGSDPNAVGCKGPGIPRDQIDPSTVEKDDDGNEFTPGECVCDLSAAEAILDVVIEGLSQLDNVICAVIIQAIVTLLEDGLENVPAGASIAAIEKAVEGAKTFSENGLDALSYFGDYIGKACAISNFNFDLTGVFDQLTEQPDDLGRVRCD
ncbi:hypothetical protein GGR53DRAFT_528579 [Hypoxylon sp. FL1150]|nr:hypothetical protein GGR53DRAFT_528579 [Hypoxylon sp. FL1150]